MQPPRITIVIPTREHADTLSATLQTCVTQEYENLEILVSDNASQDHTQKVVSAFTDPRLKYVNTGRRVSMSHNWEFGLSHATGDYVTVLGDDDGFIPGAIEELGRIVSRTNTPAISWQWASYFWPTSISPEVRNLLVIPRGTDFEQRRTDETLRRVLGFELQYAELPFLYKGLVSSTIIDEAKQMSGGVFFHSLTPDIYSAFAVSLVATEYLYSHYPFSVNGTSFYSQGASQFNSHLNATERDKFLSEPLIPFHADLIYAPSHPILVAEAFLQARNYFPAAQAHSFRMDKLFAAAMREVHAASRERYLQVSQAVLGIATKHGLEDIARFAILSNANTPNEHSVGLVPGYNVIRNQVILDARVFGVHNIYQAVSLVKFVLIGRQVGLRFSAWSVFLTSARIGIALIRRYWKRIITRRISSNS